MLYGEDAIPETGYPDVARDAREMQLWRIVNNDRRVLKIGICRGGQFLNVLNGGKLWQHVDNHAGKDHPILDIQSNKIRMASSTHHQQFRPAPDAIIVATAALSTSKKADGMLWKKPDGKRLHTSEAQDYEVLWYPSTRSLCFQPHPEFSKPTDCSEYFFELIARYF